LVRRETGPLAEARKLAADAVALLEARAERQRQAWDLAGAARTFERLGDLALILDRRDAAATDFEHARALYHAVADPAEARVWVGLGDARRNAEDRLAAYEAGLVLAQARGSRETEAMLLSRTGGAQRDLGRYLQADIDYERSLAVSRALGRPWAEAVTLAQQAVAWTGMGWLEKAEAQLGRAAATFAEHGAKVREMVTLRARGVARRELARYAEAQADIDHVLVLLGEVGDPENERSTLNLRASIAEKTGNYSDAIADGERALELARAAGDTDDEASVLGNLSGAYGDVGRYDRSTACLERALELRRNAGDRVAEANVLNNLATAYLSVRRYDRAIVCLERARGLRRDAGDWKGESQVLYNLGRAYGDLGMHEESVACEEAVVRSSRFSGARELESAALGVLVFGYLQLGRPDDAERANREALEIARTIGDLSGQAIFLANKAFLAGKRGKTDERIATYQQALAIARQIGQRPTEAYLLNHLMKAWKDTGRPELGIFYGKQAVNVYQELRGHTRGLEQASQRSFLASAEDTYRELSDLLIAAGRLSEAQQVLQMLKQEELFDFVRRDATVADALAVRVELSPAERELEARYAEVADRLGQLGSERAALLAKSERDAAGEAQLARIESDLEAASAHFQRFLDALPQQLGQTQEAGKRLGELKAATALMSDLAELGPGAVAIYTVVAEDRVWVVLTTPDFERSYETAIARAELNRKVFALQQALRNPTLDPRPAAQELDAILVAPLARDLEQAGATTLMWSLDGALRYVPVAALWDGERYLVERYRSVVFTPASQARLKDAPRPDWKVLGLGVSKAWGDFPALAGVPQELAGITGTFPGEVKLDGEFTKDTMKAALRGGFAVVHIASHFAFRPGNETESFLLLGDGGHFDLGEIRAAAGRQLFRGVDLLTLSACDTASGGAGGGDGREVEGFAVIAQDQGAKAVIASLWPVSDESTQLLMQEFYRRRAARADQPKVEALRGAQLALLRGEIGRATPGHERRGVALENEPQAGGFESDPRAPFAHPYFWAPFILIGNWR
ncbi:MAG TPA: CHAT domain-containing protein, partial [Candidatus Polarisedimenticolaceae bacterium]|nr:CHAT domain-containing protein [Candidatus Polarisedimenticolaceae bacterium]